MYKAEKFQSSPIGYLSHNVQQVQHEKRGQQPKVAAKAHAPEPSDRVQNGGE